MRERQQSVVTVVIACVLAAGTWLIGRQLQAHAAASRTSHLPSTISVLELQPLLAAGSVLVIDVREEPSFREGHITGAVHTPLSTLSARIDDLRARAAGRPIVAYCACPSEASSLKAVAVLGERGVAGRALVGGYRAWVAAGGHVE